MDRPRVVAITAARPAEGKSDAGAVAGPLGRVERGAGAADRLRHRRPSLAHRLHADNSPGLTDLLRGDGGLRNVLHADQSGATRRWPACISSRRAARGDTFGLFMGTADGAAAGRGARAIRADRARLAAGAGDHRGAGAVAAVADATILCVRWRATPRDVRELCAGIAGGRARAGHRLVLTRVDPRAHVRSGYADAEVYHRRYKAYFPG